jgi:hypothetical protein
MEALANRLSQMDPHVQGVIRVVAYYDTLMRRRVDLPVLARASAGLAECPVGIRIDGTGRMIRLTPDGRDAPVPPPPPSSTTPITLDEEELGTVWLERPGPPNPLDEIVLDRLAIAAAAVLERYGPSRTTMPTQPWSNWPSAPTPRTPPELGRCGCWASPRAGRSGPPPSARSFRSTGWPDCSARPGSSRRLRSAASASS